METRLIIKNVIYTPREVDVMSCIAMGISDTKTIALILELSTSTIENYIYNILKKFQLKSRQQLNKFIKGKFKRKLIKRYMSILRRSVLYSQYCFREEKGCLLLFKRFIGGKHLLINPIEKVKDVDINFMRKFSLLREAEEKIRKEKREQILKGVMICYWIFLALSIGNNIFIINGW